MVGESGTLFDQYRSQLSGWLRSQYNSVSALQKSQISKFSHKNIITGWSVDIEAEGGDYPLFALLNTSFPFSSICIALQNSSHFMEWPHVEEEGYLCLPSNNWLPIENIEYSIQETLNHAINLIDKNGSKEFIKDESEKEFLSYWGRSHLSASNERVLSLLNPSNKKTRRVVRCIYENLHLVGETQEQVEKWLDNAGRVKGVELQQAVFGFLNTPPSLPLPKTTKQLIEQVFDQCEGLDKEIIRLNPSQNTVFIFGAQTTNGVGLLGVKISSLKSNGFRPNVNRLTKTRWQQQGQSTVCKVTRIDSVWVHSRDQNLNHQIVSSSKIVLLGAGSLGSHVARRLTQAGIGTISIVDPDNLESSNVGRHELGLDSWNKSKAEELACSLSKKYPHAQISGYKISWQKFSEEYFQVLANASLIISCIGESDQDHSWDAWYRGSGLDTPIVYGWLGTNGATGHAIALRAGDPGISCLREEDGDFRKPEALFKAEEVLKSEPGCGTFFQPYGPLSVGCVELLVSRLSLDLITKKIRLPEHRIYTCSTSDLNELGGEWSPFHQEMRPKGYHGPLEYSRVINKCGECWLCKAPV